MLPLNRSIYDVAIEMYKAGKTTGEIADSLKVSRATVLNWVKSEGIEVRKPTKIDTRLLTKYAERYVNGESAEVLAKKLGINADTFRKRVRRLGYVKSEKNGSRGNYVKKIESYPDYDFYVPTDRCTTNKITVGDKKYIDCTYEYIGG